MRFLFKKLAGLMEADRAATENSKALLAEAEATEQHVETEHQNALDELCRATERARKLKAMDAQNHYSESLTYSFRGTTA